MKIAISGYVGTKLTGIGRVLIEVLNEMAPMNRNDEYILFKNFDFNDYDVLKKHSNIKIVNINVSKNSSLKNILWHQWNFQKLQKKYQCNVAYIPNFSLLLWKRIPTIVTIHDLIEFNVPNKFSKLRMMYRKVIDPLMVRNSSYITSVSECSKRDIIKFCNAEEAKIRVIPNAADRSRFRKYNDDEVKSCISKYNLEYKQYCLFVGTIDYPGKNIMSALKAFFALKKNAGITEKMLIVGKKGFNSEVIYNYVNGSKYKDDIVFTGYISDEDLPLIYAGAKVMLYLSLYEGFGLPVLEAMSCGIPVICPNTSCFPEVIGDIPVGVNPMDIEEIENKLQKILFDSGFRDEIARQCYDRAAVFLWHNSAKMYYEVFHRFDKK